MKRILFSEMAGMLRIGASHFDATDGGNVPV
jgi:hypothetical protein